MPQPTYNPLEKPYAFVDECGSLLRVTVAPPEEFELANKVLKAIGSDRRWMEVGE